jgi:hypothetical protein
MASSSRVLHLLLVLSIAAAAPALHAEIVTSNSGGTTISGGSTNSTTLCVGLWSAIAGGFDSDSLGAMTLLSEVPVLENGQSPLDVAAGSYPTQFQFRTSIQNTGQVTHDFEDTSICASFSATTVVGDVVSIPGLSAAGDRVLCPASSFATGGGIDLAALESTTSSGPVLDDGTADGLRLVSAADGVGAVPIGWRASAYNPDAGQLSGKIAAVCIGAPVVTAIDSVTVAAGTTDSKRVLCPPGSVAYGGGVDVNDTTHMTLRSSSPIFDDGTADGQRLMARSAGTDTAPIGWFGAAHNDDGSDHILKVAAICPEPIAEEVELAALGALFVTRRMRGDRF